MFGHKHILNMNQYQTVEEWVFQNYSLNKPADKYV